MMKRKVGCNFIIEESLGKGGFGEVYRCKDEHGNEYAIKRCKSNSTGIPNVLEAIIMTCIKHPHINNSIKIHCTSDKLNIIEDLASCDLFHFLIDHHDKMSENIIKRWCFDIAQAVMCLHSSSIIHCDIKASNVLLFDDIVKLGDFSLSVRKSNPDDKFKHKICTYTHRAPECFLGQEWDEKADIWSLGCTFFEIKYGYSFFPGDKNKTISSVMWWCNLVDKGNREIKDEDFNEPRIPENFMTNGGLDGIIRSMLHPDPSLRPSIKDIINNQYFSDFQLAKYQILGMTPCKLANKDIVKFDKVFSQYNLDNKIYNYALEIYAKTKNVEILDDNQRAKGSIWIAHKIIERTALKVKGDISIYTEIERNLFYDIGFCLGI